MGDERREQLAPGEVLRQFVGGFIDELARSGVRHACLAPGSRSTPLAILLRRHPSIRLWTHLDERSASFFALGIAKALREPVAVICTSGTAAANFAPAAIEAFYARVPLLLLTADRPPELRGVGANQTIDQIGLYGSHAKWAIDMMTPEATPDALRFVSTTASRAVATAMAEPRGPVHVNLPFREPLIPASAPPDTGGNGTGAEDTPHVRCEASASEADAALIASLAADLASSERGLIVCGPQDDPRFPEAVAGLARALHYPILADPLSQVRCGPHDGDHVIDSYDAFLRDSDIAATLAPDVIVRFGAASVSKALLDYLERYEDARQILVDAGGRWNDPTLTASDAIQADPAALCHSLLDALSTSRALSQWSTHWRELATQARVALLAQLQDTPQLSEPGVFVELATLMPDGGTMFVGNSMPVRDLDAFFPTTERSIRLLANRGASGIDGVMSTALGVSAVSREPLVLVIGDLSFYHDMNGLLAANQHGLKATIVLVNNDGGGIFSFLPQAEQADHFEELFGTPHGLDFRNTADLYHIPYRVVETPVDFRSAVRESIAAPGAQIIAVRTDRAENVRLHAELWAAASNAVTGPVEASR